MGKKQNRQEPKSRLGQSGTLADLLRQNGFDVPKQPDPKPQSPQRQQGYSGYQGYAGHGRTGNQDSTSTGYVGAPYNFVPFSPMVYQYSDEELTGHNELKEELISGEIDYEITAKSPIFIDNGDKDHPDFFRNEKGEYAIPGSSVRGLLRNNVQILGLSAIGNDVDDYRLMYRRVGVTKTVLDKGRYDSFFGDDTITIKVGNKNRNVSVMKNVKAGYIKREHGRYWIYQTVLDCIGPKFGEMNYYVLSERTIIGDYLEKKDRFGYGFFRNGGEQYLQHEYEEFTEIPNGKRTKYVGTPNRGYKPYHQPISYRIKDQRQVTEVLTPGKTGYQQGYAVGTGPMDEKKAVYIIPEVDMNKEPILIPENDVNAYKIDLENKKNALKSKGGVEAYALPEEGEIRPVFYIQKGGAVYFGYTPRLRLFFDHSIAEGLPQNHISSRPDFATAMFGYSNQDGSAYRSKLSFTDAVVQVSEKVKPGDVQRVILSSPKPSSYLDYICVDQKGNPLSYNADHFQLRGVKQYWIRKNPVPSEAKKGEKNKEDKVSSALRPLPEETVFNGTVRFQNLTQKELGLLLWSIRLNEHSWMNIGKAKAYGYGTVAVQITGARKISISKAYSLDGILNLKPYEDIDVDVAIDGYKTKMNQWLKTKGSSSSIEELPSVKDFFRMKDSTKIPRDNDIRYMSIDRKEYKNRTKPLPSVEEVQKKGTGKQN